MSWLMYFCNINFDHSADSRCFIFKVPFFLIISCQTSLLISMEIFFQQTHMSYKSDEYRVISLLYLLPVVVAALIRPLLKTALSRGLRSNLCAPPVTEISRFGMGSRQCSVNNVQTNSRSVVGHSRIYCNKQKPMHLS